MSFMNKSNPHQAHAHTPTHKVCQIIRSLISQHVYNNLEHLSYPILCKIRVTHLHIGKTFTSSIKTANQGVQGPK